jgi:ERCC4-type nuclease
MLLIADDRERAVNVFLETLVEPDQFRIERITSGDYVFLSNGRADQEGQQNQASQEGQPDQQIPVLIIERKSLSDLAASIKDGRMENHANLEALKSEHPALRIVYLIEGSPFTKPEKKINGIPFKTLLSQIDSLMFGGAHIVWAKNEEQTAARIVALFRRMATAEATALASMAVSGGANPANSASNATPPLGAIPSYLKKPHKKSLPMIHTDMVAVVPGVSRVTAALLLKRWSVFDLLEQKVSGEDLAAFTYQSGAKLGNRAAALTANLTPHHTKILAQIPGITEEVASAILAAVPFATLLGGFPKGSIANIAKANGKKIGKAAEAKVVTTFEKPSQ